MITMSSQATNNFISQVETLVSDFSLKIPGLGPMLASLVMVIDSGLLIVHDIAFVFPSEWRIKPLSTVTVTGHFHLDGNQWYRGEHLSLPYGYGISIIIHLRGNIYLKTK